jgi:hypothetical protein
MSTNDDNRDVRLPEAAGFTGFKSLTASVANALQRDLVGGRYRPGEKLPIVKLANSYGVSPGAVREALSRGAGFARGADGYHAHAGDDRCPGLA